MNQNISAILNAIPDTNPAEHEVFDIISDIEELTLTARKLKAITTAFDNTFCESVKGVDIDEIRARPEHFCYLFEALRDYVIMIGEGLEALDDKGSTYMAIKRAQQAAERATAPATGNGRENPCGDLEAPTAPAKAV